MDQLISWKDYAILIALLSAVYYAAIYFLFFYKKTIRNKKDTVNKRNPFTELNSGLYDDMQQENDTVQRKEESGMR